MLLPQLPEDELEFLAPICGEVDHGCAHFPLLLGKVELSGYMLEESTGVHVKGQLQRLWSDNEPEGQSVVELSADHRLFVQDPLLL